ncbi:MAG: FecR domain-containing protein [Candidatus Riflebacteria bacterium]|nr:FecR domain-containing protein [Candidatus Riflebacteria bacterium]
MSRMKLLVLLVLAVSVTVGCGNQATTEPLGFVEKVEKGEAFVKKAAAPDFAKVEGRLALFEGDVVKTSEAGEAVIRFATGAVTRVMPNSRFEIQPIKVVQTSQKVVYTRLAEGIAYFYVEKDKEGAKKFEVETNRAIASIKGTTFKVEVTDAATTLTVGEGLVGFVDKASGKSVDVPALQRAVATEQGLQGPEPFNALADSYLSDAGAVQYFQTGGN